MKPSYEELERYGRQADITIENLERKVEQLAAENAALKEAIKEIVDSAEEAEYDGYFSFVVNPDAIHAGADLIESGSPSTDAILAEVRASGVDLVIAAKKHQKAIMHVDTLAYGSEQESLLNQIRSLEIFAAKLRQEAK